MSTCKGKKQEIKKKEIYNILTVITTFPLIQIRGIARKWKSKIYSFAVSKTLILMIWIIIACVK
jgi:hypothetical protein